MKISDRLSREIFFTYTFSGYVVLLYVFLKAYFDPSKTTLITVNSYGEAHVEFIMFIIGIPFVLYEAWNYVKRLQQLP